MLMLKLEKESKKKKSCFSFQNKPPSRDYRRKWSFTFKELFWIAFILMWHPACLFFFHCCYLQRRPDKERETEREKETEREREWESKGMLTYPSDSLPQIVCPMDEDAIPPNPFCSAPPLLPFSSITPRYSCPGTFWFSLCILPSFPVLFLLFHFCTDVSALSDLWKEILPIFNTFDQQSGDCWKWEVVKCVFVEQSLTSTLWGWKLTYIDISVDIDSAYGSLNNLWSIFNVRGKSRSTQVCSIRFFFFLSLSLDTVYKPFEDNMVQKILGFQCQRKNKHCCYSDAGCWASVTDELLSCTRVCHIWQSWILRPCFAQSCFVPFLKWLFCYQHCHRLRTVSSASVLISSCC